MVHRFIHFILSCMLGAPKVRADRTILLYTAAVPM
jgi:hypothetical protein